MSTANPATCIVASLDAAGRARVYLNGKPTDAYRLARIGDAYRLVSVDLARRSLAGMFSARRGKHGEVNQ